MPIIIGKLRERVKLQARGTYQTPSGASYTSWSDVATFWGRMEPRASKEVQAAMRDTALDIWTLTCRFRDDITLEKRIAWIKNSVTRYFNIIGVQNADERSMNLMITLEELSPTAEVT